MPSLVKVFPLILAASVLANPFALREQDARSKCEVAGRIVTFKNPFTLFVELLVIANERNADREYERGLLSCAVTNEPASEFFFAIESKLGVGSKPNATVPEILQDIVRSLQYQDRIQKTILDAVIAVAVEKRYPIDFVPVSSSQSTPPASERLECIECKREKSTDGQVAGGKNRTKPRPFGMNGQRTGGAKPAGRQGNPRLGGGSASRDRNRQSNGVLPLKRTYQPNKLVEGRVA